MRRWPIQALRHHHGLVGLALCCFGAWGCGRSEESKRAEVASVTVAIDRLRTAANPDKAAMLGTLEKTPCTMKDVCDLKQQCVEAYRLQVSTLAQIEGLKNGQLGEGQLSDQIKTLQAQLARARDGAKNCVDAEAKLLDRYRARKDPK